MSIRIVSRTLIAVPLLWLTSMYICWVAAWQTLGRRPRPMFDDPKSIEAGWEWFYDFSWTFWSLGVPLFALASAGMTAYFLFKRGAGWRAGLIEVAIAVSLMVVVFFFSAEWFDFVYWYFD